MPGILPKIKDFFLKNETKIVLFIGFCLISAISFEFGVLQGQKWQQKPLIIEKPSDTREGQETVNQGNLEASDATKTTTTPQITVKVAATANTANCAYVGSKNSDKFYLPTCSYAKRVKPENLVCFKTADEALGQGRTESKCK
ncbi:MAG: putative secreted protein [Candidatus Moranbacteria bacterium GW2011_GWE2_36_40]|nr:MAG: putative secreted protein [Candidatus Moranbacteria bacterium GW2011_GWE2_36_40]